MNIHEHRCVCGKLLLKGVLFDGLLEIKCRRCGKLSNIHSLHHNQDKTSFPQSVIITRANDGLIISVNEGFFLMTGYSREEIVDRTTTQLNLWVNNQDRERVVCLLRDGRQIKDMETAFRMKDGNVISCYLTAESIELGTHTYILSTVTNITRLRKIEYALEHANLTSQAILSTIIEGVLILDTQCKIMSCNDSALQILGHREVDIINATFFDLELSPTHQDGSRFTQEESPAIIALKNGKPIRNMIMNICYKKTTPKKILINATPTFRANEFLPSSIILSLFDVTEVAKHVNNVKRKI